MSENVSFLEHMHSESAEGANMTLKILFQLKKFKVAKKFMLIQIR